MDARELRIGNYIQFDNWKDGHDPESETQFDLSEVHSISEENGFITYPIETIHKNKDNEEWIDCSAIEPIPLTEEWLIKLGFKKGAKGWFKTLDNNHKFNLYIYQKERYEHVHQLQNLYFALTGKEL